MPLGVEMNVEAVMKSPIVVLPVLLQIALVAALYTYSSSTPAPTPAPLPSPVGGGAEVRQLHHQREEIEARLAALENTTKVVVPRGMGSPEDGAPPPSEPSPNMPANTSTPGFQPPAK
jgi:hypothetical protein